MSLAPVTASEILVFVGWCLLIGTAVIHYIIVNIVEWELSAMVVWYGCAAILVTIAITTAYFCGRASRPGPRPAKPFCSPSNPCGRAPLPKPNPVSEADIKAPLRREIQSLTRDLDVQHRRIRELKYRLATGDSRREREHEERLDKMARRILQADRAIETRDSYRKELDVVKSECSALRLQVEDKTLTKRIDELNTQLNKAEDDKFSAQASAKLAKNKHEEEMRVAKGLQEKTKKKAENATSAKATAEQNIAALEKKLSEASSKEDVEKIKQLETRLQKAESSQNTAEQKSSSLEKQMNEAATKARLQVEEVAQLKQKLEEAERKEALSRGQSEQKIKELEDTLVEAETAKNDTAAKHAARSKALVAEKDTALVRVGELEAELQKSQTAENNVVEENKGLAAGQQTRDNKIAELETAQQTLLTQIEQLKNENSNLAVQAQHPQHNTAEFDKLREANGMLEQKVTEMQDKYHKDIAEGQSVCNDLREQIAALEANKNQLSHMVHEEQNGRQQDAQRAQQDLADLNDEFKAKVDEVKDLVRQRNELHTKSKKSVKSWTDRVNNMAEMNKNVNAENKALVAENKKLIADNEELTDILESHVCPTNRRQPPAGYRHAGQGPPGPSQQPFNQGNTGSGSGSTTTSTNNSRDQDGSRPAAEGQQNSSNSRRHRQAAGGQPNSSNFRRPPSTQSAGNTGFSLTRQPTSFDFQQESNQSAGNSGFQFASSSTPSSFQQPTTQFTSNSGSQHNFGAADNQHTLQPPPGYHHAGQAYAPSGHQAPSQVDDAGGFGNIGDFVTPWQNQRRDQASQAASSFLQQSSTQPANGSGTGNINSAPDGQQNQQGNDQNPPANDSQSDTDESADEGSISFLPVINDWTKEQLDAWEAAYMKSKKRAAPRTFDENTFDEKNLDPVLR